MVQANSPEWDVNPFAPPQTEPEAAPKPQAKPKPKPKPKQRDGLQDVRRQLDRIERSAQQIRKQTTWTEIGVLWGVYLVTIAIPPAVATVNHVRYQWEQVSQSRAAQWLGLAGEGGNRGDNAAEGQTYASPIVGKSLKDLVNYQPAQGQSFGPKTGNQRSYGPHGGVDFDCRVGGCAGAAVASPINGTVVGIEKIGTSRNGASYRLKIAGKDWAGPVEHRLVHVDSIMVQQGETVTAGQVVARVSPADSVSTGPHLDWKIVRAGDWIDPQEWAKQAITMPDTGDFVSRYVDAISRKESGHNYSAVNPDSGALGKFQFMPSTMASTAQSCIGRTPSTSEFLGSPELQNQIMGCYVEGKLSTIQAKASDAYTQCRMMASTHYSGNPDNYNNTKRQFYNGREYPSIADYTKDVCKGF